MVLSVLGQALACVLLGKGLIIEWFGLEGTFKHCLAQLPCSEQGHLQLEKVCLYAF